MKALQRSSAAVVLMMLCACSSTHREFEPRMEVVEKLVPQRCIDPDEVPDSPVYQARTGPYVPVESAKILVADLEAAKAYAEKLAALLPPCLRKRVTLDNAD